MSEIQCVVVKDGIRCSTTIEVSEPVSAKAAFICRYHPDSVQRAAAGNTKTPRPDVHFQEHQFDKDVARGARPIGTSHIHRQGKAHNCEKVFEGRTDIR
jgi:hypothetical protein